MDKVDLLKCLNHVKDNIDRVDICNKDVLLETIAYIDKEPVSGVPCSDRVIFEAVDRTDEDMYFTVGLWPTLEEAIKAFDNSNDPDEFSNDVCHEEYCLIEIRERKIGWSDTGIERAKLEWTRKYDEENDEYIWARKI